MSQQRLQELENLIERPVPAGWEEMFINAYDNLCHIYKLRQSKFDYKNSVQCPKEEDLFRVFDLIKPRQIKVVIFGQDPYHSLDKKTGQPVADGLSFSSRYGIQASLRKVISGLKQLYPDHLTDIEKCTGSLDNWVRQGVLMINKCLTTEAGQAKKHDRLWDLFIYHVISQINKLVEEKQTIIILRWGRDAQKLPTSLSSFIKCIDTGHPSPLNRNPKTAFNINCLKETNQYLIERGQTPIQWWKF